MKRTHPLMWTLALAGLVVTGPATGQHHEHATVGTDDQATAPPRIPDVALLDQAGQTVRFYSDLVHGQVIVLNTIFTTCTTICPPMGANFARLRQELDTAGHDNVQLISVSVDPAVDTPARLQAWADRFGASPGWTLLTGAKVDVDRLLKALGVYAPDKLDHTPVVLVGDDANGRWRRLNGLARPASLFAAVDELTDGSGSAP